VTRLRNVVGIAENEDGNLLVCLLAHFDGAVEAARRPDGKFARSPLAILIQVVAQPGNSIAGAIERTMAL
jgi:hypothetical protein